MVSYLGNRTRGGEVCRSWASPPSGSSHTALWCPEAVQAACSGDYIQLSSNDEEQKHERIDVDSLILTNEATAFKPSSQSVLQH